MSSSGMTVQALGSRTIVLHDHQQNKHTIQVVYVPKAEFTILSMFKLHLDICFSNDAIYLSNHRTGFSLQSVIHSDDIPWVSEGVYCTNITTRSKARKIAEPASNINESIQSISQNELSRQDLSIESPEPRDVDGSEETNILDK